MVLEEPEERNYPAVVLSTGNRWCRWSSDLKEVLGLKSTSSCQRLVDLFCYRLQLLLFLEGFHFLNSSGNLLMCPYHSLLHQFFCYWTPIFSLLTCPHFLSYSPGFLNTLAQIILFPVPPPYHKLYVWWSIFFCALFSGSPSTIGQKIFILFGFP